MTAQFDCGHLVGQAAGMGLEQRPLFTGRLITPAGTGQVSAHVFDLVDPRGKLLRQLEKSPRSHSERLGLRMAIGGAIVVGLWQLIGTSDYLGLGVPTILRAFTVVPRNVVML